MTTFKHQIVLDLVGNLAERAQQFGRSFQSLAANSSRSVAVMQNATAAAGRTLSSMGNRYTALVTGAAGAAAAHEFVSTERRLTRIGIAARISKEETQRLQQQVFDAANMPGMRVDPGEIVKAIETVVDKTGDLQFARDSIIDIGSAIQATGKSGDVIGNLVAQLKRLDPAMQGGGLLGSLDTLREQGKLAGINMTDLGGRLDRLTQSYLAAGRAGPGAVKEIGAVIGAIGEGAGDADDAARAFDSFVRQLREVETQKKLASVGVQVMDPTQPGKMRSAAAIYMEMIDRTRKGGIAAIEAVLNGPAVSVFNRGVADPSGTIALVQELLKVNKDGASIMADSARAAQDSAAAYQMLATSVQEFNQKNLDAPIRAIADALNAMDPKRIHQIMSALAIGGGALIGLTLAAKGVSAFRTIFGGRGGAGGAAGGMGGIGVTDVRVVNWPGLFGGGMGGLQQRGGPAVARRGMGAAGTLAALAATAQLADIATDSTTTLRQKAKDAANVAGSVAGGLLGFKLGALAGALGGPLAPITIPAGGVIGGTAGYLLGREGADHLARALLGEDKTLPGREDKLDINIRMDGVPRGTRVDVGPAPPSVGDVDLNLGYMMGGP